jgi:hypothetical protein
LTKAGFVGKFRPKRFHKIDPSFNKNEVTVAYVGECKTEEETTTVMAVEQEKEEAVPEEDKNPCPM